MNTYSVKMECTNCEWNGQKDFKKGTPVQNGTECPHCGCKTLRRPIKLDLPFPKPFPKKEIWVKETPTPVKYVKPYDPNNLPDIRFGPEKHPYKRYHECVYDDGHWVTCKN